MNATSQPQDQQDPITERLTRAFDAVEALRAGGWQIRVWHVDPDSHSRVVLVDGRDNYGDAFRGSVDCYGDLRGEPCDPGEEPAWLSEVAS